MIKSKSDAVILNKAVRAMRQAVKNVILERKRTGQPLIVWKNGKVVRIPASRLKDL
ncbi:MAG: hypothetical protein JW847_07450 [Candidatus Omnitrophica bacterium]|nr:hypothetical protein [Candidatus Omnitrophota bacterium]